MKAMRGYSGVIVLCLCVLTFITTVTFHDGARHLPGQMMDTFRSLAKVQGVDPLEEEKDPTENYEIKPLICEREFFNYINTSRYNCLHMREFGGQVRKNGKMDGQKSVCLDAWKQPPDHECVVYSFGISNDWSFDDEISTFGCQVYAFDPTIGKEDFNRSDRIHFYNLGISDTTETILIRKKKAKVARLEDIRKRLGHEATLIRYLKVDVEGFELNMMKDVWETSPRLLSDHVAQIGMEIHLGSFQIPRLEMFWTLVKRLEGLGFELVKSEKNPATITKKKIDGDTLAFCYEILWVNKKFIT